MTLPEDVVRLLARDHHDPHSVLGAHPHPRGVVIRALRPGAASVVVRSAGREVPLDAIVPETMFEGVVEGVALPLRYELVVDYPEGESETIVDPYSFLPTLGELDLHLFAEGRHELLFCVLGAHRREVDGVVGTRFAVWAPSARAIAVVGDFNLWNSLTHPMRSLGGSGVWELFVPGVGAGNLYKFAVRGADGVVRLKADPVASRTEAPPHTASVVFEPSYRWSDDAWMERRHAGRPWREPVSVYEVHLGSWRPGLGYRELADALAAYVNDLGFTHVELLPVMEHPFAGSWGYQVTGFFAPTARFGTPDDFRAFVDTLHDHGIGVILDWVPAHFPRDAFGVRPLRRHRALRARGPTAGRAPRLGHARVQLRADRGAQLPACERADVGCSSTTPTACGSTPSRRCCTWTTRGGRASGYRTSGAAARTSTRSGSSGSSTRSCTGGEPGIMSVAEESTAWPGVSRPTAAGGLGFGFKWNMGWMHDTLEYFSHEPVHRRFHHNELTFSHRLRVQRELRAAALPRRGRARQAVAAREDAGRPLAAVREPSRALRLHVGPSGQEAALHGRRAGPGARVEPRRFARLALRLPRPEHARCPGAGARPEPGLPRGAGAVGARLRPARLPSGSRRTTLRPTSSRSRGGRPTVARWLVCVANLSPVPRQDYRLGFPGPGAGPRCSTPTPRYYGGSDVGNRGGVEARPGDRHGQRVVGDGGAATAGRRLARARRRLCAAGRRVVHPGAIRSSGRGSAPNRWRTGGRRSASGPRGSTRSASASRAGRTCPSSRRRCVSRRSGRGGVFAARSTPPPATTTAPARRRPAAPRPAARAGSRTACAARRAVLDTGRFVWTDAAWSGVPLRDLVVYELHVGTFTRGGHLRRRDRASSTTSPSSASPRSSCMPVAHVPGRARLGLRRRLHVRAAPRLRRTRTGSRGFVDAAHARRARRASSTSSTTTSGRASERCRPSAPTSRTATTRSGATRSTTRSARGARVGDPERGAVDRATTTSTACASTRRTRSSTTAGRTCSPSSPTRPRDQPGGARHLRDGDPATSARSRSGATTRSGPTGCTTRCTCC